MSTINVNLDVITNVFTYEIAAQLVTALIECLLFQRNQIPFVFSTFEYLISTWKENDLNFSLERQRNLARITLNGIKELTKMIKEQLRINNVKAIKLLFGSTPFTAKEAFLVELPEICRNHFSENHRQSIDKIIKQTIMALLTSTDLYKLFSKHLSPTNMFVELEMMQQINSSNDHFIEKDFYELPENCSLVTIKCAQKGKGKDLGCCKQMEIFGNMSDLLECLNDDKNEMDNEKGIRTEWYEANIVVKGYKNIQLKGKNVW